MTKEERVAKLDAHRVRLVSIYDKKSAEFGHYSTDIDFKSILKWRFSQWFELGKNKICY